MRQRKLRIPIASVLMGLAAELLLAGLMLHTEMTIPTPEPGREIPLDRLVYKARFEARVSSVRLDLKSEAGADPIAADWVFAGSNSDGQAHRLEIQLRLYDGSGKQVGWFAGKHPLPAGAKDQKFAISMKIKQAAWAATKRVRIFADWIT
jgi:hypothetical protein